MWCRRCAPARQDFVVKPVGIERLQVSLRNALNASALKGELAAHQRIAAKAD